MRKAKPPRNADHVRRKNAPAPGNEVIEERLTSLLTPAILGQQGSPLKVLLSGLFLVNSLS